MAGARPAPPRRAGRGLAWALAGLIALLATQQWRADPEARRAWTDRWAAAAARLDAFADRLPGPVQALRLQLRTPDQTLAMPVRGVRPRAVADTFGAPRDGGARRHQGQDIFARRGTPVLSAAEGIVLRVGEQGIGGRVVWVLGAGGRRYYYAHLDAHAPGLAAGARVEPGALLGFVGDSGNARGTPPHLHFGVYGPGGPIDPLPLLRAHQGRAAGAAATLGTAGAT